MPVLACSEINNRFSYHTLHNCTIVTQPLIYGVERLQYSFSRQYFVFERNIQVSGRMGVMICVFIKETIACFIS